MRPFFELLKKAKNKKNQKPFYRSEEYSYLRKINNGFVTLKKCKISDEFDESFINY